MIKISYKEYAKVCVFSANYVQTIKYVVIHNLDVCIWREVNTAN